MKDTQIPTQYSTGLARRNIRQAIIAAGKDLDHLQLEDLALLEDFHTMGRYATSQLVDLIEITSENEVLDAGSGIGGTARFVADQCGCQVAAIDLTEEYCETARWLNRLVGLDERISVRQGDITELPFTDATFHVVFSQHVQMNVADKTRLYQEARRVLVSGAGWACGTSPPVRVANSTIHCHGPTNPTSTTWSAPASYAQPSSPPGSQSTTRTISPTKQPSSCRPS
jgi:sarcosine/dimethylglycine N-methyltransferase